MVRASAWIPGVALPPVQSVNPGTGLWSRPLALPLLNRGYLCQPAAPPPKMGINDSTCPLITASSLYLTGHHCGWGVLLCLLSDGSVPGNVGRGDCV